MLVDRHQEDCAFILQRLSCNRWLALERCVITCYNSHMKLRIRRVGNSLGVIIPRHVLDQWALAEGASVELTTDGIFFDAARAKQLSRPVAEESLWAEKRRQQARDLALGKSKLIFSEEIAKRAVIDGSPL